jgi:hypothetical protein
MDFVSNLNSYLNSYQKCFYKIKFEIQKTSGTMKMNLPNKANLTFKWELSGGGALFMTTL